MHLLKKSQREPQFDQEFAIPDRAEWGSSLLTIMSIVPPSLEVNTILFTSLY